MAGLPRVGDFKEYSEGAAKTPFVPRKFPSSLSQHGLPIFTLVRKHGVSASA